MKKSLALLTALLAAAPAIGSTLIDDGFTDGGRTNSVDALDTDWYKVSGTDSTATVDASNDPPLDGNALDFDNPSTGQFTQRALIGNFNTQTLGARDKLVLSLDLTLTGTAPYYDWGATPNPNGVGKVRIGLLDGSASPVTGDTGSSPSNHSGYFSNLSVSTSNSAALSEDRANISESSFMSGNDLHGITTNSAFGGFNDAAAHRVVFSVQNAGDGNAILDHRIDNRFAGFGLDADAAPQYTFNEVGIASLSSVDLAFDNIRVERWRNRVYDTFDVGSATRDNDANDPTDVQYYKEPSVTLSVVTSAAMGNGNAANKALNVDNISNFGKFAASFDRFTLDDVGEKAHFGFDYTRDAATSTATTSASGLRFGLYDSGTKQITADGGIGGLTDDDNGYLIQLGVGQSGANMSREIGSEGAAGDGILGGSNSGAAIPGGVSNGFAGFDIGSVYFIELLLTRVANGLNLQLLIDGNLIFDKTDTDARTVYSFDEFGFGIGSTGFVYDYRLDDINIDVMTIPTPAPLPAGLILIGGLAMRRRR